MTSTKKGFLKAGGILAIIASVSIALFGMSFFGISNMLNEKLILETYKTESGYAYFEDADGNYYIEYYEDEEDILTGEKMRVTEDEIELAVQFGKAILTVLAIFILGLAIAQFIISILVLNKMSKDKSSKGLIIALLVLSIITGSMLTSAFMIVALCLKDKKQPTLENISEIAAENTLTEIKEEKQD